MENEQTGLKDIAWTLALVALSVTGLAPLLYGPPAADFYLKWLNPVWLVAVSMPVLWGLFGLFTFAPATRQIIRTRPTLTVTVTVVLFVACVIFGVVVLQPMRIQPLPRYTLYWTGVCLWVLLFPFGYTMESDDRSATREALLRAHADKVLLPLATVFMLFFAAELYLRYFYIYPVGHTTAPNANQQWLALHWETNSLGFRDREPEDSDRQVVLVVGDSFAAGHGIDHEKDRFANLLGEHLGDDYAVHIVARPGWNTEPQAAALPQYPLQPDILIYSYVDNDIHYEQTRLTERPAADPDVIEQVERTIAVVNRLFIADYVYFYHSAAFRSAGARAGTAPTVPTEELYFIPEAWDAHRRQMQVIFDYAREENAAIVGVLWGHPYNDTYDAWQNPVMTTFAENNVPLVTVMPLLEHLTDAEMQASRHDGHPGERVQPIVAQAVYDLLLEHNIITE